MVIPEQTLTSFCADLSARTPTPGGGATAAVVGAIGAAQLLMVAEYADWTGPTDDPREELRATVRSLLSLAEEDAEAYAAFRAAPKGDPEAKARIAAVPEAVLAATNAVLERVDAIVAAAPKWFGVDASIAGSCLRTCAEGARALVEVNQ